MRKRILGLLLVLGIFFSLSASAWATNYSGVSGLSITKAENFPDADKAYVYRNYIKTKNKTPTLTVTPEGIITSDTTAPTTLKTWFAVGTASTYSNTTASPSSIDIDGLKIAITNQTTTEIDKATITVTGYPTSAGKKKFWIFASKTMSSADIAEKNVKLPYEIEILEWNKELSISVAPVKASSSATTQNSITETVAGVSGWIDQGGSNKAAALTTLLTFNVGAAGADTDGPTGIKYTTDTYTGDSVYWALETSSEDVLNYLGAAVGKDGDVTFNGAKIKSAPYNDLASTTKALTCAIGSAVPSYIGDITFTVRARDRLAWDMCSVDISATATYTLTISGDAPIIALSRDVRINDSTKPEGKTDTDKTHRLFLDDEYDLGHLYDPSNDVIYVGKNISQDNKVVIYTGTKADDMVATLRTFETEFIAVGTSQDFTLTGSINKSGSGFELVAYPDILLGTSANSYADGSNIDVVTAAAATKSAMLNAVKKRLVLTGVAQTPGDYEITITAKNAQGEQTKTYPFTIAAAPKITTTSFSDITWGEAFEFTPVATGEPYSWDIAGSIDIEGNYATNGKLNAATNALSTSDYITKANMKSFDITFDSTTGKISGTWKPGKNDKRYIIDDIATPTVRKIRLVATKGDGYLAAAKSSVDIELKFNPVAVTILSTDSEVKDAFEAQNSGNGPTYMTSFDNAGIKITATGPGEIEWEVTGLPDGLDTTNLQDANSYISTLVISGVPSITTEKNRVVSIVAKNDMGSATISPKITVTYDKVSFDVLENILPSGNHKVGEKLANVTLKAVPGPISWDASNLPDGWSITPKNAYGTEATLVTGSYSKAMAKTNYKIIAKNNNIGQSATLSADLTVYDKPTFTTATLDKITTHKDYSATILTTNYPISWDIQLDGKTTSFDAGGTSFISVDLEALSNDKTKLVIIGSLDRVPSSKVLKVKVKAENLAGSVSNTYEIAIEGTGAKLKGGNIDLPAHTDPETGSVDIAVTAGDLPLTMSAYIDATTAEKIFGVSGKIDLSTWNNVAGILFSQDKTAAGDGMGTGHLILSKDVGRAYKGLPVTIEAQNKIIDDDPVTGIYKVTVDGADPAWYKVSGDTTVESVDITGGKETINILAGKKLATDEIFFFLSGDAPFDYSNISPKPGTETAGLTVKLDETTGKVTVTGTPEQTTKEVKTKLTLSAKNTSTGKQAKATIEIVAKPAPVVKDKTLTANVMVGKKVNLKPALTSKTKDTVWVISEADEEKLASYDLEFTEKNGAVTGKPSKVTRDANGDSASFDVTVYASNDVGSADVKMYIWVTGAKPKLKTKKVTINLSEDVNTVLATLETDQSGKEADVANVKFTTKGLTGNLAGLALATSGDISIADKSAVKATKKATIDVTMDNYGTKLDGKVTLMVNDPAPVIDTGGVTEVNPDLGKSATVKMTVTNATGDTAINWKIASKPTGGVKVKLAKDGTKATITITAPKKAKEDIETSVLISAQNKNTKVTSTASVDIKIDGESSTNDDNALPEEVVDVTETEAEVEDTAEAPEETTEAPEETAEVEAKLTLGAERTADSLTAGQRGAVEEAGYVIAAVLPEITVTKSGQYDLEVTLDEAAPAGAELKWFAFPADGIANEDDEIVDFYDAEGNETTVVPEDHKLTIAPWFRAEVTYSPVIAVKVENAVNAKDSVEDAASGDVVTEEALEAPAEAE